MVTNTVAVFFVLAFSVIASLWLEKRYKTFKKLGAGAIAILIGIALSNSGFLPGDSPAYDFLMTQGVSASIVLILLSVDIRSIKKAGPTMLKAFVLGAVGSALGAMTMSYILADAIGGEAYKLAGQFTGTYVGGGMNFAALGRAFDTNSDLFTAGIAADVIITAIWLVVCLAAPVLLTRKTDATETLEELPKDETYTIEQSLYRSDGSMKIAHMAVLVTVVFGTIWISEALGKQIPALPEILWLTTLVLLAAQIPYIKNISGGAMLGNYLLLLFLASNGAKSVVANIITVGPAVFYFAVGTIAIHGIFLFGVGYLMKIDAGTLAVASQANVGGSSSALALASARGYTDKILPGIAVGLLGYAVGNYLGLVVGNIMQGVL
ncbi:MAG TPA: DUF819 family protein [Cyclobacteriaceae bacterium]|nr:DUF819 family protein [Cyclobacteriaceae bacterium]HRK55267.1 DUF819 family protein [Cyclobacteriaceae bacterium]